MIMAAMARMNIHSIGYEPRGVNGEQDCGGLAVTAID
jgi:hypothetical protein